jgi:predicted nucleic acid-binding protein
VITAFVLDASATLACLLPDEQPTQFPPWVAHIATARIVVPPTWPIEVANGFTMAVRRKRISTENVSQLAEPLGVWLIAIEPPSVAIALTQIAQVARDYGLTAYDAAYLEIALRLHLPLVTLDLQLAKAAKSAKIKLLA